ncbi:MAG: bifunctional tRNA (5-methylaminomethyl-2-thiouridine)(34)-methyltransferase MnmD/FAD-dependent [Burkholderiales bacterium]|nr:bifunctional tRNA (5-methylaminomethyl-2-thiouridine)(34)-methyltransferase MnmD/FAD-dependent [Burkholderiales bacterium]
MHNNYYAKINWTNNAASSVLFNNVYHPLATEESNYVFIQQNNLEQRFSKLQDYEVFIIGETGFGSGLNFLNVLNLWQNTVTTKAKLFFISFEPHPLSPADLKKINSGYPNSEELGNQYYLLLLATHSLSFKQNVYLNLVIGDLNKTLNQQNFLADCWFLNRPTPGYSSAIWDKSVFLQIAKLCKTKATFAIYTAKPVVKQNLQSAGFHIAQNKRFSNDMLHGYWLKKAQIVCKSDLKIDEPNLISTPLKAKPCKPKPWFDIYKRNCDLHVIIIGGGISGAATAYSLAKRGYQVSVYEQNELASNSASSIYQAMLYGSFSAYYSAIQELGFSGYRYSHFLIKQLLSIDKEEYGDCGLIQLGFNHKEIKSQLDFLKSSIPEDFCFQVSKKEIERFAGTKVNYEAGLYFPYGLWLNPQTLIKKLLDSPNIKIIFGHKIDDIVQDNEKWQIIKGGKIIDESANIVLCNASSCNKFNVTKNLDLRKIRGQISIVKQKDNTSTSTKIKPDIKCIKTILCGLGYITPNRLGCYTIGATYDFKNIHTYVTKEDHLRNLATASLISDSFKKLNIDDLTGQAAIRASTYDYMPLVGPIANYTKFQIEYAKLAKDKNIFLDNKCPYYKGLYLNVAHGSKGMLTAPISGEIIANYIDNTPMPCSEDLRMALHPNRLYVRKLVKGKTF